MRSRFLKGLLAGTALAVGLPAGAAVAPATGYLVRTCPTPDGVPGGVTQVTIAHVDGPDKLTVVQTLVTSRGSRTIAVDPGTHRLYLAAVSYQPVDPNAPPPAAGQRAARPTAIPDSFKVIVFGPAK